MNMKKLAILMCCLCWSFNNYGQVIEVVVSDNLNLYNGTSYEVVQNLKLSDGFRAQATIGATFFSRMKDLYFTPGSGSIAKADTDITITFNDIMNTTNITTKILVVGSQSGAIAGDWSQDGRQLVFNPDIDLLEGEVISVDVSDQLTGTLGRWVPAPYSWQLAIEIPMTYIPDDAFEQALIDIGRDDVLDDSVATSSIVDITTLDVGNKGVSSLIGIQDFVGLTVLECDNNALTSLDVSQNVNLTELYCHANQLTGLDVLNNTALTRLTCGSNPLNQLDVSANTALTRLDCLSNQLSTLDLSNNVALIYLDCRSNQLTDLDLSNNPLLDDLLCGANLLTSLDVSANTALTSLQCPFNQLVNLDVSNNTLLTHLDSKSNAIISLDVSNNTNLTNLSCSSNELISLDLSANGVLSVMQCLDNQNLICIEVNPVQLASISPFWDKDPFAAYSTDCGVPSKTYIPDDNFEQALIGLGYDNILDDFVNTAVIQGITTLSVNSMGISDFTGLENFSSLVTLNCRSNQLIALDVSNNPALVSLSCSANQLTSLNVTSNFLLETLNCSSNQLPSLDLSGNAALETLYAFNNQLTALDVSNNTVISTLDCANNLLGTLDVSANLDLRTLDCTSNVLTGLDVSSNTNLTALLVHTNPLVTCIEVNSPQLAAIPIGWAKDTSASYTTDCSTLTYVPDDNFEQALIDLGYDNVLDDYIISSLAEGVTSLSISNEGITDLTGIGAFIGLIDLDCSNNALSALDLSTNISLTTLNCSFNQLSNLTFIQNPNLTTLDCSSNQITSLNVNRNPNLSTLDCSSNSLTVLSFSSNPNLTTLNCSSNRLTTLYVLHNPLLTSLDCRLNPSLFCIRVSSAQQAAIPPMWTKDVIGSFSTDCSVTTIPDNGFEQALIDLGLDTGLDNKVLTSRINKLKVLDVSGRNISDLTGLVDFVALEEFDCSSNQLIALNMSGNPALKILDCSFNNIYRPYFGNNSQLTTLDCSHNSSLDFLNLRNSPLLTTVHASHGQIRYLLVENSPSLITLICDANPLLSALNVTNNTALETLDCSSTALRNLNVSNNLQLNTLDTRGNLGLFCIQVDLTQFPVPGTWTKDSWARYRLSCGSSSRSLDSFEAEQEDEEDPKVLTSIALYPNPVDYEFTLELDSYEGAHVRIHDLIGNLLYQSEPLSTLKTKISVKDMSPGIVMVSVIQDEVVKSFKLLIER